VATIREVRTDRALVNLALGSDMENVGILPVGENQDLSLEERKFIQESRSKNKELELKEREVATKEIELLRSRWLNPAVIGLFAATIGLIGNLIVTYIGNRNSQLVEHSRAQSSLIVQAVGTGDATLACKNLLNFLQLGLLEDPQGRIARCETVPNSIPVLPGIRTYTPPVSEGDLLGKQMAAAVTRIERGDTYHFEVNFTVPTLPAPALPKIDLILIYGRQMDQRGGQADIQLPSVHGNWKSGDRVFFSADLPKRYVDDPAQTSFLRFCVGVVERCVPSPDLLLSSAQ
jgi:hypothetical protein